jgi:hypothetical protein
MSVLYNTIQILARQSICRNKCKISVNILDNTMVQWPKWVVCTPRCPNPVRSWPIDFVAPNLKSASPNTLKTILKSSKSVHYRQRYAHFLYLGNPFEKGTPRWGFRGDKIWTPTLSHTMITTRLENTEKSISAQKSYGNTCRPTLLVESRRSRINSIQFNADIIALVRNEQKII